MKDLIGQMILPFLGWLLLAAPLDAATAPVPAPLKFFHLPMDDGSSTQAVLLPIDADHMWMVYTSKDGQIGFWMMTRSTDPIPPDPVPPPPPKPTRLTIVVIEDPERSTQIERDILADDRWRGLAMEKHNFLGIIPIDLVDNRTGKPPTLLAPFLELAKGKALPWTILADAKGNIVWQGHLPNSPDDFANLIKEKGG